ncbi:hypothetical protein UFOVP1192_59 [uncultured Caudovirales phage]|uniref:Uncharacterized protein n=1 Tax=uncultured Caudovirales phage TaxID=2100421 RepID=A0A6J5R082_9CAUD|nr:hypothetical protein UFOVP1192_59 [uncultured Caudovirales phage]
MSEVTKAAFAALIYHIKELTKERDEARRLYCRAQAIVMYKSDNALTAEHISNNMNWDCYEKEETQ